MASARRTCRAASSRAAARQSHSAWCRAEADAAGTPEEDVSPTDGGADNEGGAKAPTPDATHPSGGVDTGRLAKRPGFSSSTRRQASSPEGTAGPAAALQRRARSTRSAMSAATFARASTPPARASRSAARAFAYRSLSLAKPLLKAATRDRRVFAKGTAYSGARLPRLQCCAPGTTTGCTRGGSHG